jgi:hypothetical protein
VVLILHIQQNKQTVAPSEVSTRVGDVRIVNMGSKKRINKKSSLISETAF